MVLATTRCGLDRKERRGYLGRVVVQDLQPVGRAVGSEMLREAEATSSPPAREARLEPMTALVGLRRAQRRVVDRDPSGCWRRR